MKASDVRRGVLQAAAREYARASVEADSAQGVIARQEAEHVLDDAAIAFARVFAEEHTAAPSKTAATDAPKKRGRKKKASEQIVIPGAAAAPAQNGDASIHESAQ